MNRPRVYLSSLKPFWRRHIWLARILAALSLMVLPFIVIADFMADKMWATMGVVGRECIGVFVGVYVDDTEGLD
jgi:hypothetical protein